MHIFQFNAVTNKLKKENYEMKLSLLRNNISVNYYWSTLEYTLGCASWQMKY